MTFIAPLLTAGMLCWAEPDATIGEPTSTLTSQQRQTDAAELQTRVRELVQQLNARRAEQRQAAESALLDLGPGILDLLPPETAALPAEVQARLRRVRHLLESRLAEESLRAATVTLDGRFSLLELLERLEQQTGNRIIDLRDRFGQEITNPEIDVEFAATPFWQALDDVLARTDTTIYPYPGEAAVAIVNRAAGQTPQGRWVAYAGAFRIEPLELLARLDFARMAAGTLRLRYQIAWEPRLRPILLRQPLRDLHLEVGGVRHQLDGDEAVAVLEIPTRRGTIASEFDVPLRLPAADAEKIDRLSGRFEVLLASGVRPFRFDRLAEKQRVTQRQGATTVVLEGVRRQNALSEVRVRVRFDDPAEALESHRGWIFNNAAYLIGPDGERIEPATLETTAQSETEVGIAYIFAKDDLDGCAFVYESPVLIQRVEVSFELGELPLP